MWGCGEAGLLLLLALLPLLPVCDAIGCSSPDTLFTSQTVLTHPGTPDACYQVGCPSGVTYVIEERSGVSQPLAMDRHCSDQAVDLSSQLFSTRNVNYFAFSCKTSFLLSTEGGRTTAPITWHVYCESGDFSAVTHLVALTLTQQGISAQQAKDIVQLSNSMRDTHALKGAASCTGLCGPDGYCYPCDTGPAGGVTAVLMELPVANIDPVAFSADLVRWVAEGEGLSINCTEASLGAMATNGSTTLCGQRFELLGTAVCSDTALHGPVSAVTAGTTGGTLSYNGELGTTPLCWYLTCPGRLAISLLGPSDTQVSVSCDGMKDVSPGSGHTALSCSQDQAVVSILPLSSALRTWTWEYYCQNDTVDVPSPAQALFEVPSGGSTATDLATALVAAASALPTTTSATCLYLCDTSLCVPCGKSNTSTTADAVVVEMFLSSRYNLALANNALRSWLYGGTNPDEPCSSLAYSLQDTKVVVGCGRQLPVGEYTERSMSGVAVETGTAVFLACVLCLGSCLTVAIGAAVVYQVAPAVKNDGGPLDAADLIVIDSEPTDTMPDTESRISASDRVSAGGGAGDMEREGVSGSTGSGGSGGDVLLQPVAPVADEAASSESGSEAGGGSTASSSGSGNVDDSVLRRDPSTRIASPFDAMPVRTADGPTLFSTFPDDTIVHV